MTDIEDEIRRRILAERNADGSRPNSPSAETPAQFGAPAPPTPGLDGTSPYYAAPTPPQNATFLQRKKHEGGIVGAIASLLLLLGKLKFLFLGLKLLTFGKLLLTFGSMLLSMWVYAKLFGWPFGIGIVLLIFIHECGHALAARMRGHPTNFMVFIPFMGGLVATKRGGRNLTEDAFIGIMGPVVGSLASAACILGYVATGNPFWLALASWGFFVNLFNLAPTVPLDGGWIVPLFSPKALAYGVVVLIAMGFLNPFIWILGVLSLPRIIGGWKADPKTQPYYQVARADKWKFGVAYLGLAAILGAGYYLLHTFLRTHYPVVA